VQGMVFENQACALPIRQAVLDEREV
jgi:hypothetical protein